MIVDKPQRDDPTRPQRMAWWHEARFGMFIHYGLYAVPGRGEWVMNRDRIPPAEYAELVHRFEPAEACADEWVRLARRAGMKYVVLTTRHHDGFCLWDSGLSDFTVSRCRGGRDLVADYVAACRREGLKVGFYYSLKDWSHPNWLSRQQGDSQGHERFLAYIHGQVRELCTNYGTIDVLWYDGPGPYREDGWRSEQLNAMVRDLQPGIVINCRSHLPEDFDTPEQHVRPSRPGRAWESCMTLNGSWGYHAGDTLYKTPAEVIATLARIVHAGGNLLLNVGPEADGTVPPRSAAILRDVGRWLEVNGEAIYGTSRSVMPWNSAGLPTQKGNAVYQIMTKYVWPEFVLAGAGARLQHAEMLGSDRELPFKQDKTRIVVAGLPRTPPDPVAPVLKLSFESTPTFVGFPA